jgi:hypothetical protein
MLLVLVVWTAPLSAQEIDRRQSAPGALRFAAAGPIASDNGYAIIAWESDGPATLDITRSDAHAQGRTLYSGENTTYFISGLSDGVYTLTLRDDASRVADSLELSVAHQSLTFALWLIALGSLVFLSIVSVIIRGARDE